MCNILQLEFVLFYCIRLLLRERRIPMFPPVITNRITLPPLQHNWWKTNPPFPLWNNLVLPPRIHVYIDPASIPRAGQVDCCICIFMYHFHLHHVILIIVVSFSKMSSWRYATSDGGGRRYTLPSFDWRRNDLGVDWRQKVPLFWEEWCIIIIRGCFTWQQRRRRWRRPNPLAW